MPLMSPVFREMNYARIEKLAKKYSDSTIAGIVSDETGETVTTADITSYRKVNGIASRVMLVSASAMSITPDGPLPA